MDEAEKLCDRVAILDNGKIIILGVVAFFFQIDLSRTNLVGAMPLVVMGFVTIPVGLLVFGIVERFAKKTGRLKRSG